MIQDEWETLHYPSPIGLLKIQSDGIGISAVRFRPEEETTDVPQSASPILLWAKNELEEYFAGIRREFTVPLSLHGTPFQKQVWAALQQIPYGQTRSYRDIAKAIGNPKASRAVGMANNRNPVIILVPCHRVIGTNGALVGYACGLNVKQQLLALEYE